MKSRESRKIDHIRYALHLEDGPCSTGFSDMRILHCCLPEVSRSAVSLETELTGVGKLSHPIIINAMTGGAPEVKQINADLAAVARETGSAMAVGSQYGAVRKKQFADTFSVVRQVNPHGKIFANVSALAGVAEAREAVEMVGADALQIHLNAAQELAMEEGDRDFSRWLDHIAAICEALSVPVIAKETGCGIGYEEACALLAAGVSVLDTGGAGGTNFPAIEHARYPEGNPELAQWGIPSLLSLTLAVRAAGWGTRVICSGGIRSALDIVKAQVLGACAVGVAGPILRCIQAGGPQSAINWIRETNERVKDFYTLSGCTKREELRRIRYYITGDMAAALSQLSGKKSYD